MAYVGEPRRRKEDLRFLTGNGQYVDDVQITTSHMYVLRSPHANAKINSIDISHANKMNGVLDIITGEDIIADKVGSLPCAYPVINRDGSLMIHPHHPVLVSDRALHVGDPIIAIVADTLEQAEMASKAIIIDFDVLPSQTNIATALSPNAKLVREEYSDNKCFDWGLGDQEKTEASMASAAHTVSISLRQNRVNASPMETRSVIGCFDVGKDEYTLYTSTQNPHSIRSCIASYTLGIPEEKIRVISPDVGGGFGMKIYHYSEEALVLIAAKRIGKSVRWVASRTEAYLGDTYARDHLTDVTIGLTEEGVITALQVHTIANMGAYLSTFAPAIPTFFYGNPFPGPYKVRDIYIHVEGFFTNTTPVDAYRGAGRPEMTYVMERVIQAAADHLNIDSFEIRRRNAIPPDAMPYKTPFLHTYDSGDIPTLLNGSEVAADLDGFELRKKISKKNGKLRGLGVALYLESCGMGPSKMLMENGFGTGYYEVGTVRVTPTGRVIVLTGSHQNGQGHETAFAQVAADRLGISPDQIDIVHGDTGQIPYGVGTYGSRSLSVGGSAIMLSSDKIIVKMKKIAAHMLRISVSDLEFEDGIFKSRFSNDSKSFNDVANRAYAPIDMPDDLEPGLEAITYYDPEAFTFPYGSHIVEVEVDPQTGVTKICRYLAVDDFGRIVNPMIVDGQLHGGAAQAIGQALMEDCIYDEETGQILTGSFLDYAMPRATDIPTVETISYETICTTNPTGSKGCGEASAIAGPAAVINAICNALGHLGVKHIEMPATPERVWNAIQTAQSAERKAS